MTDVPFRIWQHVGWVEGFTTGQLQLLKPKIVYDIGCCDGFYGKLVKNTLPKAKVIGMDTNKKWVDHCRKLKEYDEVKHASIIDEITQISGDLIIFGNALPHIKKQQLEQLLKIAIENFSYIIYNGPIGVTPQFCESPDLIYTYELTLADLALYHTIECNISDFTDSPYQMMNVLIKGKRV